jgi:hypothetical protein
MDVEGMVLDWLNDTATKSATTTGRYGIPWLHARVKQFLELRFRVIRRLKSIITFPEKFLSIFIEICLKIKFEDKRGIRNINFLRGKLFGNESF